MEKRRCCTIAGITVQHVIQLDHWGSFSSFWFFENHGWWWNPSLRHTSHIVSLHLGDFGVKHLKHHHLNHHRRLHDHLLYYGNLLYHNHHFTHQLWPFPTPKQPLCWLPLSPSRPPCRSHCRLPRTPPRNTEKKSNTYAKNDDDDHDDDNDRPFCH